MGCSTIGHELSTGTADGGYHGRTLGALSLTSGQRIRAPFHLLEASVDILPYPGPGMSADQALVAAQSLMAERAASCDLPALVLIEAVQAVSGLVFACLLRPGPLGALQLAGLEATV